MDILFDGSMQKSHIEMIIRDSQGHITSYMKTNHMEVLNTDSAKQFVDSWPIVSQIERDGEKFNVVQYIITKEDVKDGFWGGTGATKNTSAGIVWYTYAQHNHYYQLKGETATYIYTIYRPA